MIQNWPVGLDSCIFEVIIFNLVSLAIRHGNRWIGVSVVSRVIHAVFDIVGSLADVLSRDITKGLGEVV